MNVETFEDIVGRLKNAVADHVKNCLEDRSTLNYNPVTGASLHVENIISLQQQEDDAAGYIPTANIGGITALFGNDENSPDGLFATIDAVESYALRYQASLEQRLFNPGIADYKNRLLEKIERDKSKHGIKTFIFSMGIAAVVHGVAALYCHLFENSEYQITESAMWASSIVALACGGVAYARRTDLTSNLEKMLGTPEYDERIYQELKEKLVK